MSFVAECKWWDGPKACSEAVDQLLSYLPWRDEKAALLLFVDRKDATAAIGAADKAIRDHPAFKRAGASTDGWLSRRNYVLGHPDDPAREIKLAGSLPCSPAHGADEAGPAHNRGHRPYDGCTPSH